MKQGLGLSQHESIRISGFSSKYFEVSKPARGKNYQNNEVQFDYVEKGGFTFLFGGNRVVAKAGQLFAFWAAIPNQVMEIQSHTHLYILTVPLAWFLRWQLNASSVSRILNGDVVFESDAKQSLSDLHLMSRWHHDLQSKSVEMRQIVLLEVEARMRRLAHTVSPSRVVKRLSSTSSLMGEGERSKAVQMALLVAQRYAEPLSMEAIAQNIGLSTKYAMTIFKKTYGRTLLSYLTQHRVSHAQRLLATTNKKVLDIALESGFGSASQFYDIFLKSNRSTPRQYRLSLQRKDQTSQNFAV